MTGWSYMDQPQALLRLREAAKKSKFGLDKEPQRWELVAAEPISKHRAAFREANQSKGYWNTEREERTQEVEEKKLRERQATPSLGKGGLARYKTND